MAKSKKSADVKTEAFTRNLKIELTREEVEDRAARAAHLLNSRDQKEEEMKAAAKHAKGEIEQVEADMRHLSTEVRTRSTYGTVECEKRYDYTAKTYMEVRLDTGETLEQRSLTEREMQRDLPFEE